MPQPGADRDDEPVPRLPRTRGFKLSTPQLVRIGLTAGLLVLVILVQRPCANSVSKFVTGFGDQGSAAAVMPRPGTVDQPAGPGSAGDYVPLRPDMTEAEIKAAIEEARAKAARREGRGGSGAGSAAGSAGRAAGSAGNAAGSAGSAGSAAGSAGSAAP